MALTKEASVSENVLKLIKEKDASYVDLRFTDVRGKLQHVAAASQRCHGTCQLSGVGACGKKIEGT